MPLGVTFRRKTTGQPASLFRRLTARAHDSRSKGELHEVLRPSPRPHRAAPAAPDPGLGNELP